MDEYCIVLKRVIDATKKELPASHPAESKDVISLTGLINRILSREGDDWKKASILSSTLERYMALTAEKRETAESADQKIRPLAFLKTYRSLQNRLHHQLSRFQKCQLLL